MIYHFLRLVRLFVNVTIKWQIYLLPFYQNLKNEFEKEEGFILQNTRQTYS